MKNLILSLLLFVSLVSCSNKEKTGTDTSGKRIFVDLQQKETSWNDFFEKDYKIIKLESTSNSLIGRIDKILFNKDRIFILDRDHTKSVFIFNAKGKFINRISNYGDGPGEYKEIADIFIKDSTINILQSFPAKIMSYNFDGKFINERRLFDYAWKIASQHNNYWLFMDNSIISEDIFHNLILVNSKGEVIKKFFPINQNDPSAMLELKDNFWKTKDGISFMLPFRDTIYNITTGEVRVKYIIDFGRHSIPNNFFANFKENDFNKMINIINKKNYAHEIIPYFETNDYMYFGFRYNDKYYHYLWNKSTNKFFLSSATINPINLLPFSYKNSLGIYKNYLVNAVNVYPINKIFNNIESDRKKWKKYSLINPELISFYGKLNNKDNPILIFYKIKNVDE